jgi:hypothetical protein
MKRHLILFSALALALTGVSHARQQCPLPVLQRDITSELPEIDVVNHGFKKLPDVAQYKNADWSEVIGVAKNISLNQAYKIAEANPEITYFFYTKGVQMVLETEAGDYRVFRHGDTVFFKGTPWWGSAPSLADGYERQGVTG